MFRSVSTFLAVFFASSCVAAPPSQNAATYLDRALLLLEEKHINSGRADWPSIRANALERIDGATSTDDTYPAIRYVLAELDEKHSYLLVEKTVSNATHATERPDGGSQLPQWRLVGGRIGFVNLPALNTITGKVNAGPEYTHRVKAGLQELDSQKLCGWIIDLRNNGGGNMWPMLQGLDPLLGQGPFGYFVIQGREPMPWRRTASGIFPKAGESVDLAPTFSLKNSEQPVALLIGPQTASSGEMTAVAFIGREGVRTFGESSAGFTTANTPYPLSDGAILVITETTVRDRTGTDYAGQIAPDQSELQSNAENAAVDWLEGRCSG